jgi:hypothetical protein
MTGLTAAATMSLDEFLIQLARENPAMIEQGRRDAFADLVRRTAPPAVGLALCRFVVGLKWRQFQPAPDAPAVVAFPERAANGNRARQAETAEAIRADVARQRVKALRVIGPDFVLDGRRLAEWTANDLRKVGGVFAVILEMVPARKRNRPLGEVLTAAQWRDAGNTKG